MLSASAGNPGWLMIIYRIPSTPSTPRVIVWKKIRELGAHLLQQSVYILPNLPKVRSAVDELREQIIRFGGEAKIIEIASLGEDQEKEVIAGFNASRDEEYTEVVKACNELLSEIADESRTEDFHFADLEENEKHIQRVKELLDGVKARDYFHAPLGLQAARLIDACQQKFEEFSHEVFSREGVVIDEKRTNRDLIIPARRERATLPTAELLDRISTLVKDLMAGTFEASGKKPGNLPGSVLLSWEIREFKSEKSLDIEITWSTSSGSRERPLKAP